MRSEGETHEALREARYRTASGEALGPPQVDIAAEFANVPQEDKDVYFQEFLENVCPDEGKGPDWKKLQRLLTHPDVYNDPVLARYAVRPFLFRPDWLRRAHRDALKIHSVAGSAIDQVFSEYLPLAENLLAKQFALGEATEGSNVAIGIEIEAMNSEGMEIRTDPTRDPGLLIAYVDVLDDMYRRMRGEIHEAGGVTRPIVGVYDNVHLNAGIRSEEARIALTGDVAAHRGPYQLLTTVGLLANSIGRMQYFAESWWGDLSAGPVTINEEDVGLKDVARLQNRLWSFSLDHPNRPMFELMIKTMSTIVEGYEKDPDTMRDQLEAATADIITRIAEIDHEMGGGDSLRRYSELFDTDSKSSAMLPSPKRIAGVDSKTPSLPGRHAMLRFAMQRIGELVHKDDARPLEDRVDDTIALIDEVLAENEKLNLSVDE